MKIGDKVILTKDIPYDGGVVKAATVGEIANIVIIQGEVIVLFNPLNTTQIYTVNIHSVKKLK